VARAAREIFSDVFSSVSWAVSSLFLRSCFRKIFLESTLAFAGCFDSLAGEARNAFFRTSNASFKNKKGTTP
jgi:hypothetical protein